MENKDKNKEAISLLQLLAMGSTGPAQQLLKKYGQSPAKSPQDLANKLADLYKRSPDKVAMEEEFVSIHPHKRFILKYTKAAPINNGTEMVQPIEVMTEKAPTTVEKKEEVKSSCEGCPGSCGKSSAEGKGAEAVSVDTINKIVSSNNTKFIVGTIGAIAVLGLLLHYKKI